MHHCWNFFPVHGRISLFIYFTRRRSHSFFSFNEVTYEINLSHRFDLFRGAKLHIFQLYHVFGLSSMNIHDGSLMVMGYLKIYLLVGY